MPGFMPGTHVFTLAFAEQGVDGRDKPGHDVNSPPYFHCHALRR
jgi:hypothetical protein